MSVFWLQFRTLVWKNWITLSKRFLTTIFLCFILPIAYGVFLATAQLFLNRLNTYGVGSAIPIKTLENQYDPSLALVWIDNTNGTSSPTGKDIIARMTSNFSPSQLAGVRQLSNFNEIRTVCRQNFALFSECFAGVAFDEIPADRSSNQPINYTIYGDTGLAYINVEKHTSDMEKRILPLQWAIDKAIIELQTGIEQQTPLEWPFTNETNEEQLTSLRLSYLRGIRDLIGLAFFVAYIGIAYQLPGAVANERALLITHHMKAMGLRDSARILSWHVSYSLMYLPAWIIVSLIWKARVFVETNAGIIVITHILLGLVLASWSFFIAAPFGKSPQLAAVVTSFLALIFAIIALVFNNAGGGASFIFSILFPPGFYIFALRVFVGYNNHQSATNILQPDPDMGARLLPVLIAAIIDIFLWPYLAVLLERHLYEAPIPGKPSTWKFWRRKSTYTAPVVPEGVAISIRNMTKVYKTSRFSSKGGVTAVSGLTLDIPKTGIFVLLGSNGAGKSTALSVVAGMSSITEGTVTFEGGVPRPPRGTLGIVPQKNVLFTHLNCLQTLRVWRAVKWSQHSEVDEDLEQLLKDCDLETKIKAQSSTLSGGQKRKLQLAIGLVGGSKIVLVDECTSGVDPLSRRALWRTLTSIRDDRCVMFTTHFLDEADLLADHIAILAAPGKVVANGSPVALKRDLGDGYSLEVSRPTRSELEKVEGTPQDELLDHIRTVIPGVHSTQMSPGRTIYHLKTRDALKMQHVLEIVDTEVRGGKIATYNILGTTIEDIFLDLMSKNENNVLQVEEKASRETISPALLPPSPKLATGRSVSPFVQAATIFRKRVLIARRSWLAPFLAVLVAVCGACIPLIFIKGKRQSCKPKFRNATTTSLFLPSSSLSPLFSFAPSDAVLDSPAGLIRSLGDSTYTLRFQVRDVEDNTTLVDTIAQNFRNISFGGISLNDDTGSSLVAWEATYPGYKGPAMLNLVSNVLYNRALNISQLSPPTPRIIKPTYALFPPLSYGILVSLKWIIFFGAAMAVYPAFFTLYVSKERLSSVQAMHFSNGLTNPFGLWLGHLMFDTLTVLLSSTIITIIFATVSNQLHGLGYLWLIMVLYGIAAALFAYCISLLMSSPLAAFAALAGYQFIVVVLYLSSYLLVMTYAAPTKASSLITIIHFTTSIVAPISNLVRAGFVSINLFFLLCDGTETVTSASYGTIKRFGGPILYLIGYIAVLLGILFWTGNGSRKLAKRPKGAPTNSSEHGFAAKTAEDPQHLLEVVNISKSYNGKAVVDTLNLGVPKDTVFALLGPNGAGKTTTFNIIRGDVLPDVGDVFIDGASAIRHPRTARSHLGVCPQFTAIDSQLTVREHLLIYGRLKGLTNGPELLDSVEAILHGTSLVAYADRLASKLSGGNQRKLSLAIALIGNPSVILIDEFSTGIDPKMKRDLWQTLRQVSVGKAVVITTHSMEEASALASSVGILAKRLLAVGTTESLSNRYATYEVHFTCRTREEVVKARSLMALIPGSRMADDVATRFEVPISQEADYSLSKLFNTLAESGDFSEYTVERATLESVFLKVIRENDVREEDPHTRRWWWFWRRTS